MSIFAPPPPPQTRLARYRNLSPLAAVHVSPLVLGAMSIGDKWSSIGYGAMDKVWAHGFYRNELLTYRGRRRVLNSSMRTLTLEVISLTQPTTSKRAS